MQLRVIRRDRLRRGRGQPLEARRHDDHPHRYGSHRSADEISGSAGGTLDPPRDNASRSAERSFEVESRGGFARTVVGQVAYLDDEAQTYMVLTRDGVLVRVPLRDITSSHGVPPASSLAKISRG